MAKVERKVRIVDTIDGETGALRAYLPSGARTPIQASRTCW